MTDITRLLHDVAARQPGAREDLARELYDELRGIADRELAGESRANTLQATAVVHEAWMRLFPEPERSFENRAHFFGAAAQAIRRVLIDHARRGAAQKRGAAGRDERDAGELAAPAVDPRLLDLDAALDELAEFAPELAELVELRFFGGLSVAETSLATGASTSTIERQWRLARAWLRDRVGDDADAGGA